MSSKALYFRLLRYVLPYWRVFLVSIVAMTVAALTEPAFPAIMKPMLDGTFVQKDRSVMQLFPLAIVAIFVVRGIASFLSDYAINWVGTKVVADLKGEMFHKLASLPARFYDATTTGNLISRITYDVQQVTSAATNVVSVLAKDTIAITGLLVWLLILNPRLTLVTFVVTPLIAAVIRLTSKRLRRLTREGQRALGEATHVLEESIKGHRVVKIFGGEEYESNRFQAANNRLRRFLMKQAVAAATNVPTVQILASIALAVIVYLAVLQAFADETSVGGFVSFIVAMLMLLPPLKRLTGVNESLQRGLAAAESVFELLDETPEPDSGSLVLERARGLLQFERVSFAYRDPEQLALADVSLTVQPGETIALVGPSGSGKTTFANLIPRFYHPTRGKILLDGHDVEDLKLASLRANIALVSQDVVLFNDSVAANIAYGPLKATREREIVAAAEAAHAMEFIREMPDGLKTLVGENGVRLSGGQRQRLAIARALLKNAPVLILDEATSSLDSESERHVQAALEALMQGRTTIVIAHRLSTVERANRIVVLNRGQIVETGSHRELLAHGGLYAGLYRLQFADTKIKAPSPAAVAG